MISGSHSIERVNIPVLKLGIHPILALHAPYAPTLNEQANHLWLSGRPPKAHHDKGVLRNSSLALQGDEPSSGNERLLRQLSSRNRRKIRVASRNLVQTCFCTSHVCVSVTLCPGALVHAAPCCSYLKTRSHIRSIAYDSACATEWMVYFFLPVFTLLMPTTCNRDGREGLSGTCSPYTHI